MSIAASTAMTVINLDPRYIPAVIDGRKTATIRLGRRSYHPGWAILKADGSGISVCIESVRYCRMADLTELDAQRDGFKSLDELLAALQEFYPQISPEDEVTIVAFGL